MGRPSHVWVCLAAVCVTMAMSSRAGSAPVPLDAGAVGARATVTAGGIWISHEEILALPTHGPAWEALWEEAHETPGLPNLSDQDQDNNIIVLAKALVCVRLLDAGMCEEVRAHIMAAIETENGGRTLALGRELLAYVIAADLVGLPAGDDAVFRAWLAGVRHEPLDGMTLVETHERRPNNWGTHAGASRIAAAIYLGDTADLARAADVFQGWLGDRAQYAGFSYGDLDWQATPSQPVGINAAGTTIAGHPVDGVLPDEQRRSGGFAWPPPQEGYVWEGLQGALAQAVMLGRLGYDVWEWSDRALLRALVWLHEEAQFPADGDDTWLPYIVNYYYGTNFPVEVPARSGKNAGFTDWTHPSEVTTGLVPSPLTINFGAVTGGAGASSGGAFTVLTDAQQVTIKQIGGTAPLSWTVSVDQPWLQVSPSAGTGNGTVTVTVIDTGNLPLAGTLTGSVTLNAWSAANTPMALPVRLALYPPGASAGPFGVVDSPLPNLTGVTGSLGVTGWALDDIGISTVSVYRDAVGTEVPGALVFLGVASRIEGARGDVAAVHPTLPSSTLAGWGFLVLTNMLPNGGNGSYTLHIFAQDLEGHVTLLGSRTFEASNDQATAPFGAIETPSQGETVAGSAYLNFGWALTPVPKAIPADGSTITVFVDGAPLGTVDYGHFRDDIASLFPGLANSNGAVGFAALDTTQLANGIHTIAWGVTDDAGEVAGIGSRFFHVFNPTGAATLGPLTPEAGAAASRVSPPPSGTILVSRGYDLGAEPVAIAADPAGGFHVMGEELERLAIVLGAPGAYDGALLVGGQLRPLPVGSALDSRTGLFTWQPAVGFIGSYPFVFTRHDRFGGTERLAVRVDLAPMHAARVSPQMAIDRPAGGDVVQPFTVEGWAIDRAALDGPGVDALHVWAYPADGAQPIFVGAARLGGARPDVGALFGAQFTWAGYGLTVSGLAPGVYDLVAFAHSRVTGTFNNARVTRVVVRRLF